MCIPHKSEITDRARGEHRTTGGGEGLWGLGGSGGSRGSPPGADSAPRHPTADPLALASAWSQLHASLAVFLFADPIQITPSHSPNQTESARSLGGCIDKVTGQVGADRPISMRSALLGLTIA